MIKNEAQAKGIAKEHLAKSDTLVVGEHGDVHVNCNLDEICTQHEEAGEEFFILKGERGEKKKQDKPKDNKK